MNRYVYGEDERLIAWAEERIPNQRFRSDACAIGHERDGVLVGVMVADTFSPGGCCIGLASDGSRSWMTREFAVRVFGFCFLQCGFRRITCIVSTLNEASLRYTERMGWTQEGVLRQAGQAGEDMIIWGMLRSECRWLPENNPSIFPVKAARTIVGEGV